MHDWWTNPNVVIPRLLNEMGATWFGGEAFPLLQPVPGRIVSITCKYLRAPNRYVDDKTSWSDPIIDDWENPPSLEWRSGILLVVTGISIGMMLYRSGAAEWLSVLLLGGIGGMHPFIQVFLVILIVSFLKIAFSSNTVTATIVIPIMIALAGNIGVDPLTIAIPAALTTSMAFILVTSSPTNVIPYAAGYFTIKDMAVAGVAITIVASGIVSVVIFVVGSLRGLY